MKNPKFSEKQILKALRKFSTISTLRNTLGCSEITARKYVAQLEARLETKKAEYTKGRPAILYRVAKTPAAPAAPPQA